MFLNRVGYRTTKAFHSSLLILPSSSASASTNVLSKIPSRSSSGKCTPDSIKIATTICFTLNRAEASETKFNQPSVDFSSKIGSQSTTIVVYSLLLAQ
uniref:Calcineurin B-like protein 10 n=1 Tax=Rhizophora mucronata TaxID=61149 RepID=A0A2P2KLX9_RHIMU